jgi:hypothetical protein
MILFSFGNWYSFFLSELTGRALSLEERVLNTYEIRWKFSKKKIGIFCSTKLTKYHILQKRECAVCFFFLFELSRSIIATYHTKFKN